MLLLDRQTDFPLIQYSSIQEDINMNKNLNVANYALTRLSQLGIDLVFGVPGDYSFPIDDAIEDIAGLDWIVCSNELNAAYAADGYARLKGAAILTTTYAVGELSALNGMMGAKAHRLPIFHLVGAPSSRIQKQHLITHHSLGDGIYGNFSGLSAATTCVSAYLTPENAIDEMERVIREALRQSAPAYISIPQDLALMPVIGTPIVGIHLNKIRRTIGVPEQVKAAVSAILSRINSAKTIVGLPSALITRYGQDEQFKLFIDKFNIQFATMPMDKGILSEDHPGYIGLYNGDYSSPSNVKTIVESADLILDVGGVVLLDLNTGLWSNALQEDRTITIGDCYVKIGAEIFSGTCLGDVLSGLIAEGPKTRASYSKQQFVSIPLSGKPNDPIDSSNFYPRLERFLRSGDTLIVETGSCILHLPKLKLGNDVNYQAQTLWGSIGWATPATLGIALAALDRRAVLVTGDGAHQLTATEIGVMGRYKIKPIIFVLNNGLYGVEDVLSEVGHVYDDLARWDYHKIPEAMGCKDWLTARITTVADLDAIFAKLNSEKRPAYIEVMIPPEESQPISRGIISRIYKADSQ